jgi:hypothetical protein
VEDAAFHGVRIADQIEVGVGLPALAGEAFATLLGGDGGIGAGVGVGEDGVVGLVHGGGAGAGDGGGHA